MVSISVITPSFNQGSFITATIDSVLGQEGVDLQYMVLDGGSSDETVSILKSYGSRLSWVSEPDKGQSDAINRGFALAKGEILGWLNSDDLYVPGTLAKVAAEFERDTNLMLLYGKANHVDANGEFLNEYPCAEFRLEALSYGCFICQPACFFRRSLFEAATGLDPSLQYAFDLDLWIKFGLLKQKNPHWGYNYIPQLLACSRMHRGSKTIGRRHEAYLEIIAVVKKHFNHVPFNWIYGAEEAASGQYDGYFRRHPFSLLLLLKSLLKWGWSNRHDPIYILRIIEECSRHPRQSADRIGNRIGERF
ncbi:MAG TPA: glycosyltransferase family 2 protein [Terriglobia bacterium]|nr:glycosyltransferase family 2 protein [Terriglobia bacterium]